MSDKCKLGVIDVGGGYRAVFGCGVFDYCLDHGISFDLGIGISAGSANIISYAAGQRGRNLRFYTEYGLRPEYAGLKNFFTKRNYIDLDYVYRTLSNSDGEDPLDYAAFAASSLEYYVLAGDAESGAPVYFNRRHLAADDYAVLKASCAIPFVCQPQPVDGHLYFDGAVGDPIPIEKAFELGCDKLVLILSLPEDTVRASDLDRFLARRIRKKYPQAAACFAQRAERYNREIALARQYAAEGRLLIVAPDSTCGVHTICKDVLAMHKLYNKGYAAGARIGEFLAQ